jgi:hypothetical protein
MSRLAAFLAALPLLVTPGRTQSARFGLTGAAAPDLQVGRPQVADRFQRAPGPR